MVTFLLSSIQIGWKIYEIWHIRDRLEIKMKFIISNQIQHVSHVSKKHAKINILPLLKKLK